MRAKALLAAVLGVALCLPATAQTVDDIIAKNIAARGGKEKLAALKSARITGHMTMGPGMQPPFTIEWKAPNHIRMEFTVQGKTGVRAFDGSTAWQFMPFMGKTDPEKMAEEDRADMEQEADMIAGPLVDYQQKGHHVTLVGKKEVEGTDVYDLQVTLKNGDVVHEMVDADSYLVIAEESKKKQGDQELDLATAITNYKEVNGLMLPFSLETKMKGAPAGAPSQTITVDNYEFGAAIDETRFAFPANAAAAVPAPAAAPAASPAATKPPGA